MKIITTLLSIVFAADNVTLEIQREQIEKTIEILRQKYINIDSQLKQVDAKNPNLSDIDFTLLNSTNHLVIEIDLPDKPEIEEDMKGPLQLQDNSTSAPEVGPESAILNPLFAAKPKLNPN